MKILKLISVFIFISAILFSCKSPDIYDDAVRIKDGINQKYDTLRLQSGQEVLRSSSALRGHIKGIRHEIFYCSDDTAALKLKDKGYIFKEGGYERTFVLFADKKSPNRTEKIPLEDIDLIGEKKETELDPNKLWFETYNEPMNINGVREIRIDTVVFNNCKEKVQPCDCEPIDINLSIHCPCKKGRCTNLSRYFIEAKMGLASYNDLIGAEYYNVLFNKYPNENDIIYDDNRGKVVDIPRTEPFIEISSGIRFGGIVKSTETVYEELIDDCLQKVVSVQTSVKEIKTCNMHWAVGLSYLFGLPTYTFSYNTDLSKLTKEIPDELLNNYNSALMLYLKYNFNEIFCTRPFVYAQFGIPTTDASFKIMCQEINCETGDCGEVYNKLRLDPDLDIGFPTAGGIGVGADIPITCKWDLSIDLGFKTFDITEKIPNLIIYGKSPYINRQLYLWTLRFGINI